MGQMQVPDRPGVVLPIRRIHVHDDSGHTKNKDHAAHPEIQKNTFLGVFDSKTRPNPGPETSLRHYLWKSRITRNAGTAAAPKRPTRSRSAPCCPSGAAPAAFGPQRSGDVAYEFGETSSVDTIGDQWSFP
jgi:hypothetical protein